MSKIGLLSDIHGNLAALQAVLERLESEGCEQLICLGDLVGYGARPAECIAAIRDREIPCLMGNHDQYATLLMDDQLNRLRDDILASVRWTQAALDIDTLKWLSSLPMAIERESFSLVHGAFGPKPWLYCANEKALAFSFAHQKTQLGFCGHSHVPLIAMARQSTPPLVNYLRRSAVPEENQVMINVGSVGQPRDRDPRAACVTYDPETRRVDLLRVEYDIAQTQQEIHDAGLPERFAERLALGR